MSGRTRSSGPLTSSPDRLLLPAARPLAGALAAAGVSRAGPAKVIATARHARQGRRVRSALRRAAPGARVHGAGFTSVFVVEAEGDALELARRLTQECGSRIGHATAVLAEEVSEEDRLKVAAVRIGVDQVRAGESFCFRLRKRGAHGLRQDTPLLEKEIGSAIWLALEERDRRPPKVVLEDPDIMVLAEVLGPVTAIGIVRKDWAPPVPAEQEAESSGEAVARAGEHAKPQLRRGANAR